MSRGASGTIPGLDRGPDPRWRPLFVVAALAFLVSLVVFVALVASAACGSDGGGASASSNGRAVLLPGGDGQDPGSGNASPATQTAVSAGSDYLTGPNGEDISPVVACGKIDAAVDKRHRLAPDCEPERLVQLPVDIVNEPQYLTPDSAAAIIEMVADAKKQGLSLFVVSSYRSYAVQEVLYQYWVDTLGPEEAERTSAHPGHSEHQLGTTADLSTQAVGFEPNDQFALTPEGRWVGENSWKYGFIVSYPEGKEGITGYAYEPWHVRWVGKAIAAQVHASGKTLHEFLAR